MLGNSHQVFLRCDEQRVMFLGFGVQFSNFAFAIGVVIRKAARRDDLTAHFP